MMGAYNGAGSVIPWMTPPPLTSHLKTFWGPKFELPALKILTTWNVHKMIWCKLYNSSSQFYNFILAHGGYRIFPLQQHVNRKAALHVYFGPVVAKSIGTAF